MPASMQTAKMLGKRSAKRVPGSARQSKNTRRARPHLAEHGAGDDVARRQVAAGIDAGHDALPELVDERRPLAAHGLGDQRHRIEARGERCRVELHELEVGEQRAGARGDRQPRAPLAARIGRIAVERAEPAGGESTARGVSIVSYPPSRKTRTPATWSRRTMISVRVVCS